VDSPRDNLDDGCKRVDSDIRARPAAGAAAHVGLPVAPVRCGCSRGGGLQLRRSGSTGGSSQRPLNTSAHGPAAPSPADVTGSQGRAPGRPRPQLLPIGRAAIFPPNVPAAVLTERTEVSADGGAGPPPSRVRPLWDMAVLSARGRVLGWEGLAGCATAAARTTVEASASGRLGTRRSD
jgi:hypothetical protein